MSLSSSTSLSQETEILHHPYQGRDIPGPRGAFESRQHQKGLYVRVDMPGVPPDNLKLRKYSDTRTVTFSGTAPIVWDGIDSSDERVYGGYVVLDRDPTEVDMSCTIANGCLRLFFPNADGSLHSLSNKKLAPLTDIFYRSDLDPQDPSLSAAAAAKFFGDDTEMIEINAKLREIQSKDAVPYKASESEGVLGGNMAHINPFLLSGVEGVYEHRVVQGDGGNDSVLYIRMDMPGISSKQYTVGYSSDAYKDISYEGTGDKESPYDEGGRRYLAMLYLRCSCCSYRSVKSELKDGVFRLLAFKSRSRAEAKPRSRSGRRAETRLGR